MKRLIIILTILFSLFLWNNYYPSWTITGVYVSNNERPILEGPQTIDTLILYENGTFKNSTWGSGKFQISGDQISFSYHYSFGQAGFLTHIDRPFFIGKPRFSLNKDLGYYYKKE